MVEDPPVPPIQQPSGLTSAAWTEGRKLVAELAGGLATLGSPGVNLPCFDPPASGRLTPPLHPLTCSKRVQYAQHRSRHRHSFQRAFRSAEAQGNCQRLRSPVGSIALVLKSKNFSPSSKPKSQGCPQDWLPNKARVPPSRIWKRHP